MSTSDRLQRIEAKVRRMEQTLGLDNPQVGLSGAPSRIFSLFEFGCGIRPFSFPSAWDHACTALNEILAEGGMGQDLYCA